MPRLEKLERELNLKQLQINSLLAITQAINENVSAEGLYSMYNSFLRWEIGIRKMALFFKDSGHWECKSSIGIEEKLLEEDPSSELLRYRTKQGVQSANHPLISEFDMVIPVMHKEVPIAYALIGGFLDEEDVYNKVQFVTTITNVIAVALENKRLFKQQMRQQVLNREVELAGQIQRTLVPSSLPSGSNYELSSIYRPHFAVGGDYYDVVEFADGKLAFCIADITGKGFSAAMLMAYFQANLRTLILRCETLEEVVKEMNSAVHKITQGDRFVTLFLARYDTETRTLHYINAGHTPPLVVLNGEVVPLKNGCTVLGWLPELPFIEIGGVSLMDDALIFTYTDGLTDVQNKSGEAFGEDKLIDFLLQADMENASKVNKALLKHVENYREREPYPDDITVLSCKVYASRKSK